MRLRFQTCIVVLALAANACSTDGSPGDETQGASPGSDPSDAEPATATDASPPSDTDTDTDTDGDESSTGSMYCEPVPDYSQYSDECAALLRGCYSPPCDFEYDSFSCVYMTLDHHEACAGMGSEGSSSSSGSDTDANGSSGSGEPTSG